MNMDCACSMSSPTFACRHLPISTHINTHNSMSTTGQDAIARLPQNSNVPAIISAVNKHGHPVQTLADFEALHQKFTLNANNAKVDDLGKAVNDKMANASAIVEMGSLDATNKLLGSKIIDAGIPFLARRPGDIHSADAPNPLRDVWKLAESDWPTSSARESSTNAPQNMKNSEMGSGKKEIGADASEIETRQALAHELHGIIGSANSSLRALDAHVASMTMTLRLGTAASQVALASEQSTHDDPNITITTADMPKASSSQRKSLTYQDQQGRFSLTHKFVDVLLT